MELCPSWHTRYFRYSVFQWLVLGWGPLLRQQLLDECQSKPACNYNFYKHCFGSDKGFGSREPSYGLGSDLLEDCAQCGSMYVIAML
ncbi:hypothetical protein PIB30_084287 [Stylosanthes scabra]|uniref:Uncharacterized protein n=1 Tax=Stylosanthes scabra TaxID=79078 RepID=A0ABU6UUA2_9FABA|nr:hypothetical protein [Stylosanthes scabra]